MRRKVKWVVGDWFKSIGYIILDVKCFFGGHKFDPKYPPYSDTRRWCDRCRQYVRW